MNIQSFGAFGSVALYLIVLLALAQPLSSYLYKIMVTGFTGKFAYAEKNTLAVLGIDTESTMNWRQYAVVILVFNLLGVLAVFGLQLLQGHLPFNPDQMAAPTWHSALNTAVSFVTNTNWQGYGGESSMSYLTQMMALTVQNFLSAATGIAVLFAILRGLTTQNADTLGNAWLDLWRVTIYVLLPISLVIALLLVGQGVIQTFSAHVDLTTLEGAKQALAMGPVASQEAIKMLGTNGGGFFNANSAHPFENPTAISNFIQMIAIFLIPTALCFCLGKMSGNTKHGYSVLAAMVLIFVVAFAVVFSAESMSNPALGELNQYISQYGNMEGKEVRFGIVSTALFAVITTAASCGAVNSMHDSMMPLGGMVTMLLMQLGEVVFGGVGSGLYGMLVFVFIAVFVAGQMIGRTPEYLGKKVEPFEIKMVVIAMLVTPFLVLSGTALSLMVDAGRAGILNPNAHGFSEVLYALSSAANNNGSAFAGLSANTPFYNLLLAVCMFLGRFGVIIPMLALAGSMAKKPRLAVTSGTLATHGGLFVGLLVGVVLLVGALTYIPALALGPIVEHVQLALGL